MFTSSTCRVVGFTLATVTLTTALGAQRHIVDFENRPANLADLLTRQATDFATNGTGSCTLDQTQPPGNLSLCGNSTLFFTWRPRARFIAPEGWMNDPQGLFQMADGTFHAGYQCNPQHITWGNISQCAAFSKDLVYWEDANSWQDPKTLYPTQLYDMRGVFDGTIIKKGWEGYPTTIYTSTYAGSLGATSDPPEQEGAETQSIAYTKDYGKSWIKLNYGAGGNPVLYKWPVKNMTGFRDPHVFESPSLAKLLANTTHITGASGSHFMTISGGVRLDADSNAGPRLYLYRQTSDDDVRGWTYLCPLLSVPAEQPGSAYVPAYGKNFETAFVARLNEGGEAQDDGSDEDALDLLGFGTEQGRNGSHENHWPLWAVANYKEQEGGVVAANVDFRGVTDWGRVYAAIPFSVTTNGVQRSVLVGWTYEDDEDLVLTQQRGYQGAFTLFRDLFVKKVANLDPSYAGLDQPGSWKVKNESDGSISVITVGQKIIPEIVSAYKSHSKVWNPTQTTLNETSNYVPFAKQPESKHYVVKGTLRFGSSTTKAGFRLLASDKEWTDVYYDPLNQTITVQRMNSSLISSYGSDPEYGQLTLWPVLDSDNTYTPQPLNLTIVVDASIVEVYANDVTVLTTRVYPWLSDSLGAGYWASGDAKNGGGQGAVKFTDVEVWDGLVNAWPQRPKDTRKGLLWDGPTAGTYGLWTGQ